MKFETTLYHPQKGDKLHIGIIPDGGRRWAIKNEVSLIESYIESRELLLDIITYLFSQNVS